MPQIADQAVVEKAAVLADDVVVGPFSYVGPQVRIGAGCVIANNVTLTGRTVLGEASCVFPLAAVGLDADGRDDAACVIGPHNALREHVTVYGGREAPTRIGNDNLIMVGCVVGPGAVLGDHGIFANATHIGAGAVVEDYVRTSAFTDIAAGVRIGAYAFTAGYSEVLSDVPPYAMIHGHPVRVRGVNTKNLRRCNFGEDEITALKNAYRLLFNGSGAAPGAEQLQRLSSDPASGRHVQRLCEALRRSLAKEAAS